MLFSILGRISRGMGTLSNFLFPACCNLATTSKPLPTIITSSHIITSSYLVFVSKFSSSHPMCFSTAIVLAFSDSDFSRRYPRVVPLKAHLHLLSRPHRLNKKTLNTGNLVISIYFFFLFFLLYVTNHTKARSGYHSRTDTSQNQTLARRLVRPWGTRGWTDTRLGQGEGMGFWGYRVFWIMQREWQR